MLPGWVGLHTSLVGQASFYSGGWGFLPHWWVGLHADLVGGCKKARKFQVKHSRFT